MSDAPKHAKHAAPAGDGANGKGFELSRSIKGGSDLARGGAHAVKPEVLSDKPTVVQRLHDFAENRNPYTPPERLYTDRSAEGVSRLDGTALSRPFDLTMPVKIVMGVAVAAAAIIGGMAVFNTADTVLNAEARSEAAVGEVLSREVSLDLPVLKDIALADDATMRATLEAGGAALIDVKDMSATGGLSVVKLPADVDPVAALALWAGTGSVSASDAASALHGAWFLSVEREDYVSMTLRFADFDSSDEAAALAAAVTAEGLDGTQNSEVSEDSSGNLIQTGAVDAGGVMFNWQVSVCPLSEVFPVDGMPSSATYVGVRLTQQAA